MKSKNNELFKYAALYSFNTINNLEKRKKTVRRRQQSSKRRSKTKQRRRNRLNPKNYSVGTIIRSNGQLMKLSPNKQWLTI